MKHRCKDVKLEWFCVWIGLVALFSCESNQLGTDYVGKLRLSLIADTTSLSKGVNGVTKAVNAGEFDAFLTTSDYRISILQEADTMHVYERFDEMPAEVELKEGAYTLIAEKGNNLPAAFENPYFAGSVDFSIRADMSTPIDVTCTLANARITVEYTDDFKEAYSDYTVLLSSAFTSNDLEIAKGETRPAYLQVAKEGSELGVAIRLKKVNEEEEKTYHVPTPLSIERRQNIRLIFKTDGAALEGIGLEVLLDDELTELTLNEGIPDFMWKPFEKPTLSPDGFQDMEELTINDGDLEKELSVGFVMPAGISSLCIKQWREDKEEDVITYDLATDEGVAAALDSYFKWTVNNRLNGNVKEERKAGQLFLKDAINSLAPPAEEGQTYTYHWEFSGVDATGKGHETNTLHLTIVVQPAGMPIITVDGFSAPVIVEGDAMSKGAEVHYKAGSGIDETKTSLVVNKGEESETYQLFDNSHRTSLKELGIDVQAMAVKLEGGIVFALLLLPQCLQKKVVEFAPLLVGQRVFLFFLLRRLCLAERFSGASAGCQQRGHTYKYIYKWLHDFSCAYLLPVWPNPPLPRSVSSSISTSCHSACSYRAMTIWAMRSPSSMTKSSADRLIRMIPISPR